MSPIKVLVVDDSALMRKLIKQILESDPDIEVLSTAMNGRFALQKLEKIQPDIITLDIEMPEMNGIEFLQKKKEMGLDIPILVLSSLTSKGSEVTMEALENGASDYICKPSGSISVDIEKIGEEILLKVKSWAKKSKNYYKKSVLKSDEDFNDQIKKLAQDSDVTIHNDFPRNPKFGMIGISTGGPEALRKILPRFETDIPIVIVQHMPRGFTKEFATSIDRLLDHHHVKEIEDGDVISKGKMYIAEGDTQVEIVKSGFDYILKVSDDNPMNNHKPSVDYLFKSCSEFSKNDFFSIIMTGMGKDGAFYITKLHHKGVFTICQDESTSIVYGMPRVAKEMSGIDLELPLFDIPEFINKKLKN